MAQRDFRASRNAKRRQRESVRAHLLLRCSNGRATDKDAVQKISRSSTGIRLFRHGVGNQCIGGERLRQPPHIAAIPGAARQIRANLNQKPPAALIFRQDADAK